MSRSPKSSGAFVSRGGDKLHSALEQFHYSPRDKVVLDVGASTGGFSDCLLQQGARYIFAVDVGYGQLAWKLRQDPRVHVVERFNARYLTPEVIKSWGRPESEQINLIVMDVSFISILKILPALMACFPRGFELLSLVKPQFEAGREFVGKGGIIKDPAVHEKVLEGIKTALLGWGFLNLQFCKAGITGTDGNQEYFVLATLRHDVTAP